jgi:hypothetical protein
MIEVIGITQRSVNEGHWLTRRDRRLVSHRVACKRLCTSEAPVHG